MDGADAASPSDGDISGALAWAAAAAGRDGRMRTWIDLDGHACVGSHVSGHEVMLWTASLVLLRHLEAHMPGVEWRGARVLELSAGTGHLAAGLVRLGALTTATECSTKHSTTAMAALQFWAPRLLRERPGAAESAAPPYGGGARGGTLTFRTLDWGADEDGLDGLEPGSEWDVLLLSELVALGEELQERLIETLGRLLGPRTVAYSCFCERPFSMGFLVLLSWDTSFIVEAIEVRERCGMHEDEVLYLHRITRPDPTPRPWAPAGEAGTAA